MTKDFDFECMEKSEKLKLLYKENRYEEVEAFCWEIINFRKCQESSCLLLDCLCFEAHERLCIMMEKKSNYRGSIELAQEALDLFFSRNQNPYFKGCLRRRIDKYSCKLNGKIHRIPRLPSDLKRIKKSEEYWKEQNRKDRLDKCSECGGYSKANHLKWIPKRSRAEHEKFLLEHPKMQLFRNRKLFKLESNLCDKCYRLKQSIKRKQNVVITLGR